MIPDHREVLVDLTILSHTLIAATKAGDANTVYQTLSGIERLAAFHKARMMSKMVLDLEDPGVQDEDL